MGVLGWGFYYTRFYTALGLSNYLMNAQQATMLEDISQVVIGIALYFDGTRTKLYVDGQLNNDAEVIARRAGYLCCVTRPYRVVSYAFVALKSYRATSLRPPSRLVSEFNFEGRINLI